MDNSSKQTWSAGLGLFASLGTILCCALPALLISLGMGAVFAGLVSNFPGIIWLSQYKIAVFSVAGGLIFLSGIMRYAFPQSCPADPAKAKACQQLRTFSGIVFWISVVLYLFGFFFAFLFKYFQ